MVTFVRLVLAALVGLFPFTTSGQEPPPASQPSTNYLLQFKGCALLVGGSVGASFAEPDVSQLWHDINKSVSDFFYRNLVLEGYRVVRLTVSVAEARETSNVVVQAMARQRCNRILQISNDAGEDASGKYFGFVVTLLRVVPKEPTSDSGANAVTEGEYSRKYRFPRDSATFDSFRTGTFANTAFNDIKASGVLKSLASR